MKPFSYLCFTILSIVVQFCLMDLINERIYNSAIVDEHKTGVTLINLTDIFKSIKEKPHAVYYRNEKSNDQVKDTNSKLYNNMSLPFTNFPSSTDYMNTVFDLLYEENTSSAEDNSLPTEGYYTTSEFDNVTEITLFDQTTTMKPSEMPSKNKNNFKCSCDLLYKRCDIGCCCDSDCSEKEREIFNDCEDTNYNEREFLNKRESNYFMSTCSSEATNVFYKHLLCIDKINLGSKRKWNVKEAATDVKKFMTWHSNDKELEPVYKFNKTEYRPGQPVWILENGTFNIILLPATVTNQYCNGQKIMTFLQSEHIKCYVKMQHLHMLHVVRLRRTNLASPTQSTSNSSVLNCTTLHCVNWTLSVCDESVCGEYNETQHLPTCFDSHCNNIATKVEYDLFCSGSIITKAVIKLYVKRITTIYEYYSQEVIVNYYMGNDSVDEIVKHSGSPGYLKGFPVIASFVERNHTEHFYNRTGGKKMFLSFPHNENGICSKTNFTYKILEFGQNKRIKCRLALGQQYVKLNKTDGCIKIQERIIEYLGLNGSIFISPYGNPNRLVDDEWILLRKFNKSDIYGQYRTDDSKFVCNNMMTRFTFVIVYADASDGRGQRTVVSAAVAGEARAVALGVLAPAAVVTLDARFLHAHDYFASPSKSTACDSSATDHFHLTIIVIMLFIK